MAQTLAPLPSLPSRSKAKAPRKCECGCDQLTRGGRYIPGHDSRQYGWALRIVTGAPTTGITDGERKSAERLIASDTEKGATLRSKDTRKKDDKKSA